MAEEDHHQPEQSSSCGCFAVPYRFLVNDKELGMDENFALVSILVYSVCGQQ